MSAKAASHHSSNFKDKRSVSLIENILARHGRVMPNISVIDKWPNIDGRLEVHDDNGELIGPISVQAKTINTSTNLKFSCPVSFLAYCDIEPCLLLGVDNETEKVYWLYFDTKVLKSIDFRKNKNTKTISFLESQYFDATEKSYIDEWTSFIEINKRRLQGFDDLDIAYKTILENTNETIGTNSEDFINLHTFIDAINKDLDINYPTVKKFFYPNTWKLGIAYEKYKKSELSYALYPIPFDNNDVQIKQIDKKLGEKIKEKGLGFSMHFQENPIKDRPNEYAKTLIGSKVMKLAERKLLSHKGHSLLAREFLFAFIDKFHEQLGLTEKDEYSIRQLQFAFSDYLPIWIEEAYKLMIDKDRNNIKDQIARKGYFDIDILWQIMPEERKEIQHKTGERLGKGSGVYKIANDKLDIGVFLELLSYMASTTKTVERVYRKPDYSRLEAQKSHWVWSKYSKDDALHNIKIVIDNLISSYDVLVTNNFPALKGELDLFREANRIKIHVKVSDHYGSYDTHPTYKIFYLNDGSQEKTITLISEDEATKIEKTVWSREKSDREKIGLIAMGHSGLDFIFKDTPLMDLTYQLLEEKLKEYLGK